VHTAVAFVPELAYKTAQRAIVIVVLILRSLLTGAATFRNLKTSRKILVSLYRYKIAEIGSTV
jgi:hypothetical protein